MIEDKIFTLLNGSTIITSITSNRIYPVIMPQEPTYPLITYQRISGGQVNGLEGYLDSERPTIQIDVWVGTYSVVKDLADKVHALIDTATTFKAILRSDIDFYEDVAKIYRVSMDFSCFNKQ